MCVNKVNGEPHKTEEWTFNDIPQSDYGVVNECKLFDKYPKYGRDIHKK